MSGNLRVMVVSVAVLVSSGLVGAAPLVLEPAPAAGKVSTFAWPEVSHRMELYLPYNYNPEKVWPVIFYYHGANTLPGTELYRLFTGGGDYILVGMTYRKRGPLEGTLEALKVQALEELELLHEVREALAAEIRLDRNEVYLAGFDKGGWMASMMLELDAGNLAGALIQGAGRAQRHEPMDDRRALQGKPIYVGIGQTDPGYLSAHRAAGFWKLRGAEVTLEEYNDVDHALPVKSPTLKAWLFVRNYQRNPQDAVLREGLKTWYMTSCEMAGEQADPLGKYLAYREIMLDPRFSLCGRNSRTRVEEALNRTRNDGTVQKQWLAEQQFLKLIREELNAMYVSDYQALLDGWMQFSQRFAGTEVGKRADNEVKRLNTILEKSQEGLDLGTISSEKQ